jgi:hypothetical protein
VNTVQVDNTPEGIVLTLGSETHGEQIVHLLDAGTAAALGIDIADACQVFYGRERLTITWDEIQVGDRIESLGNAIVSMTTKYESIAEVYIVLDNGITMAGDKVLNLDVLRDIQ